VYVYVGVCVCVCARLHAYIADLGYMSFRAACDCLPAPLGRWPSVNMWVNALKPSADLSAAAAAAAATATPRRSPPSPPPLVLTAALMYGARGSSTAESLHFSLLGSFTSRRFRISQRAAGQGGGGVGWRGWGGANGSLVANGCMFRVRERR